MEYMKAHKKVELGFSDYIIYILEYCTDTEAGNVEYILIKEYMGNKLSRVYAVLDGTEMLECICEQDLYFRICQACGAPFDAGYTDDYGCTYFCTYEEFAADMDERYGSGNWRPEPVGNKEWCYEYRDNADCEWIPEPSYYTEWI